MLIVCPGHIGDGNMHPTVVFDRGDAAAAERAQVAFDAIMRLALELGGTITGEHGVGLLKRDWLREELGRDLLRAAAQDQGGLRPARHPQPRQGAVSMEEQQ